jgi:hypothetical protein
MEWKGRRQSTNVDDARGRKMVGGAGIGLLLQMVGRLFGWKGKVSSSSPDSVWRGGCWESSNLQRC